MQDNLDNITVSTQDKSKINLTVSALCTMKDEADKLTIKDINSDEFKILAKTLYESLKTIIEIKEVQALTEVTQLYENIEQILEIEKKTNKTRISKENTTQSLIQQEITEMQDATSNVINSLNTIKDIISNLTEDDEASSDNISKINEQVIISNNALQILNNHQEAINALTQQRDKISNLDELKDLKITDKEDILNIVEGQLSKFTKFKNKLDIYDRQYRLFIQKVTSIINQLNRIKLITRNDELNIDDINGGIDNINDDIANLKLLGIVTTERNNDKIKELHDKIKDIKNVPNFVVNDDQEYKQNQIITILKKLKQPTMNQLQALQKY